MTRMAGADGGDERPRRRPPRDHDEAERGAAEATDAVRLGSAAAGPLHDGPVPERLRAPVEEWTGADLSHVRLDTTTDPRTVAGDAGLVAAADATTVYTGLARPLRGTWLAEQVLVHELVHAAQLPLSPAQSPEQGLGQPVGESARKRRVQPLRLGFCGGGSGKATDPFDTLRAGGALTPAEARSLLDAYDKLGSGDRDRAVAEFHKIGPAGGGIRRLLESLDPKELETRRATVADIQERVQRLSTEATAGQSVAQLGASEGAHMKKQAEAQALAEAKAEAATKGLPPPPTVSGADVAKAHEKETKKTSPVIATVTNTWDAMSAADQGTWNTRAAAAITKVVAACAKVAPELGITAANLKWAPKEVAQAGANVYAFSGDPLSFGMGFVETAEANPDYTVRTVVHEIAGHPSFGDRYRSTEAKVYAEAHEAEPTLGTPWDTEEETNTFAYLGTEIYAALREVPYEVPLSKADTAKGLINAIAPAANIDNKLRLVKAQFTPGTAKALVQGLYERFRVDPRITPKALALFATLVEKIFGKVLK